MKSNNIIEINGRLYDATTGAPLHKDRKTAKSQSMAAGSSSQRSVDGFAPVRSSSKMGVKKPSITVQQPSKKTVPITKTKQAAAQPTAAHKDRTPAPSMKLKAHQSTTLHRRAVKKPSFEQKSAEKSTMQQSKVSSPAIKHAESARSSRAAAVEKSSAIRHFHNLKASVSTSQPTSPTQQNAKNDDVLAKKEVSQHMTKPAAKPTGTKERLISTALAKAALQDEEQPTNHRKPAKRTRSHGHHITRYAATALVVLILTGYVAYLNIPSLSMKVAAHRAGFAASLPSYNPVGYSLSGPIAYSPGQVTINFSSNADGRKFSLTQQPTTWDSTALLENYVMKQNPNYLTYQDSGLTIYIYGGSSASWVNGGKMYHLEGNNSQLDTDQLLQLATSV